METIFYSILLPLTIVNAAMAYVFYTKIQALDEIMTEIFNNQVRINAITERLDGIEEDMKDIDVEEFETSDEDDFSDFDSTTNDGIDELEWEEEIEDQIADLNGSLNHHTDKIQDLTMSVNSVNQYIGEVAQFADRLSGRLDQIENTLRQDRPESF